MQRFFTRLDTLSRRIDRSTSTREALQLLLQRAVNYSMIQNYEGAIDDLTTLLMSDSTSVVALWQRAVCQQRLNEFHASQGTDVKLKTASVLADLSQALKLQENAYLYYNRGNVYVIRRDYQHAIEDYSRALEIDSHLAEAYYNRGLARIANKQQTEGIGDLSKAGELGLYAAYSIIKRTRKAEK